MFLGQPSFSSWLTAKLLATYARKRFNIVNKAHRQAYIAAHYLPELKQWKKPIDLKRVSFTNLSIYNTEYSVFKYLLETELDVLKKAPYNQLNIYPEIIEHTAPNVFNKQIAENSFLVGIHSGHIEQISNLMLNSEAISKILEPFNLITEISERFLKSFAMELAVKAAIYQEYAIIFNNHSTVKNSAAFPKNIDNFGNEYKNEFLVGEFLTTEIQNRTRALVESKFFEQGLNKQELSNEMLQLCIASLYVYYAQQTTEISSISAAEKVFCNFHSLTDKSQTNTELMLKTMQTTLEIMQEQGLKVPKINLNSRYESFINKVKP